MIYLDQLSPSLFRSINARALRPDQVAYTFVPYKAFDELVDRCNSIIVGPRGSGKTSLLKMLMIPALEAWGHEKATEYRNRIDYSTVYVATDRTWKEQISSSEKDIVFVEEKEPVSIAAFNTHVYLNIVDTMNHRLHASTENIQHPHLRAEIGPDKEAELTKELSSAFFIQPRLWNLRSLKFALLGRLTRIGEISKKLTIDPDIKPLLTELDSISPIKTMLNPIIHAISIFNEFANDTHHRWALLFDELELAPVVIQKLLYSFLRSTEQKLLFKLSICPYGRDLPYPDTIDQPIAYQDFNVIRLWYDHDDTMDFSKQLFLRMTMDKFGRPADPLMVLGRSWIDTKDNKIEEEYVVSDNLRNRKFAYLFNNDVTFREYYKKKNINPDNLESLPYDLKSALIRKPIQLFALRETFRIPDRKRKNVKGQERIQKAVKSPVFFTGAAMIFAICEGNPRWFKGIMKNLISEMNSPEDKINRESQIRELKSISARYRVLLRTIPLKTSPSRKPIKNQYAILDILDAIGEYIYKEVVTREFSMDPVLGFTVDANLNPQLMESLGRALNAGAIMYVPSKSDPEYLNTLRDKRFRLSYLLSFYYKNPIRLGRTIKMSEMLTRKYYHLQKSLFEENKDDEY